MRLPALHEVDFNVTDRCNLRCRYCSVHVAPVTDTSPELSLERIGELFEELDRLGVRLLRIAGGEPFVRRDMGEILERAARHSFALIVLTNGTALRQRHVEDFQRLSAHRPAKRRWTLAFSVDGVTAADHDASRGCATAFSRIVERIDHCVELGIDHAMMSVVTDRVVGRLVPLVEFAGRHGMSQVKFILLGFTGPALAAPGAFPSYGAWSRAVVELTAALRDRPGLPATSLLLPHEDPVPREALEPLQHAGMLKELERVWGIPWRLHGGPLSGGRSWCLAGQHNITILPNGDVYGCDLMRNIPSLCAGNVLKRSVSEVFWSSEILTRLRNAREVYGCARFDADSKTFSCGQCRAGDHTLRRTRR